MDYSPPQQQPYGGQMAYNQIMPSPQTHNPLDPQIIAARLNKIRTLASFDPHKIVQVTSGNERPMRPEDIVVPRQKAIDELPTTFPIPLRFLATSSPFICKKCQYKGKTRIDVSPELSRKGWRNRCICLLIPIPICTIYGLCGFCKGTPCRDNWSDWLHVCPQCETVNAVWLSSGTPATEVNSAEIIDALKRMQIDPVYGRYF